VEYEQELMGKRKGQTWLPWLCLYELLVKQNILPSTEMNTYPMIVVHVLKNSVVSIAILCICTGAN